MIPTNKLKEITRSLVEALGDQDSQRLSRLLELPNLRGRWQLYTCMRTTGFTDIKSFTNFRSRVNGKSKELNLDISLDVDSKKRSNPRVRECWFSSSSSEIDEYSDRETEHINELEFIRPHAIDINSTGS